MKGVAMAMATTRWRNESVRHSCQGFHCTVNLRKVTVMRQKSSNMRYGILDSFKCAGSVTMSLVQALYRDGLYYH